MAFSVIRHASLQFIKNGAGGTTERTEADPKKVSLCSFYAGMEIYTSLFEKVFSTKRMETLLIPDRWRF